MNFFKDLILSGCIAFAVTGLMSDGTAQASDGAVSNNIINKTDYNAKQSDQQLTSKEKCLQGTFKAQMDNIGDWPVKRIDEGGTLLFSDSPETVYQDGILYQDTVAGKGRLYYYHVNGTDQGKKVVVLLSNTSDSLARFKITRSSQTGPNTDYLSVGKASQIRYFGYQEPRQIIIDKSHPEVLENRTNRMLIKKDELVCGIYDFDTDKPTKITVMMMPIDDDPFIFMKTAKVLPKDASRLRGTFKNMDRILQAQEEYDPDKDGAVSFTIADDKDDKYLTGTDATDGSVVKNYGNYGVMYYLDIPMTGTGKVHYFLQPLGGVYAGAVAVKVNSENGPVLWPTPSDKTFFGENPQQTYYADLGVYNTIDNILFEYSPPGASNLPVNIILTPAE